jgi:hypothetical protein
MRDKTREGAESAQASFESLNMIIGLNKVQLKELQAALQQLYATMNQVEKRGDIISPGEQKRVQELQHQIEELKATILELETAKKKESATPILPDAERVMKSSNNLNMSIQQIAREMPTLALGPQMFFLAISNNLPVAADAIKRAKDEYNSLTATGQKATPVWKQVLSSVISWQTAMVVGVTLLIAFSKNIVDWIKSMSTGQSILEKVITSQQALNKSRMDGETSARKELSTLNVLYGAATDVNRTYKERKQAVDNLQDTYPKYFKNLSDEAIMTGNAANKYRELSSVIIQTAMARAKETQLASMAQNMWKLQLDQAGVLMQKQEAEAKLRASIQKEMYLKSIGAPADNGEEKTILSAQIKGFDEKYKQYEKAIKDQDKSIHQMAKSMPIVDEKYTSDNPKTPKTKAPYDAAAAKNRIDDATLQAQKKINEDTLAAMQDGFEKRKAQADYEYKQELADVDKNLRDREKKISDAEKHKVSLTPAEKSAPANQAGQERIVALNKYKKSLQDIANDETKLSQQQSVKFKSDLDQKLLSITQNYDEQLKQANGNADLTKQLEENKEKEITKTKQEYALKQLQLDQEVALASVEAEYKGVSDTRLVEEAKNKVILDYAKKRLALLKTMPDEDSQHQANLLEAQLPGMTQTKKQPKNTVSGAVDEELLTSLTKKYVALGNAEDVAKKKAVDYLDNFHDKMQMAASITGGLKEVLGGVDEHLDVMLDSVDKIAQGFASGGLAGGILATAGTVISLTKSLTSSKEGLDESIKNNYSQWLEAVNNVITKQTELLSKLGAIDLSKNLSKMLGNRGALQSSIDSAMNMIRLDLQEQDNKSANLALAKNSSALKKLGIETTNFASLTKEQILSIKDNLPGLFASLPDQLKTYINSLSDAEDKLSDFNDQLSQTVLGFDYSDITTSIVDAVTDPSISDASDQLWTNISSSIGTILKNEFTRTLLTSQLQTLVNNLLKSMEVTDANGTVTGYSLNTNTAVDFANKVKDLGESYKEAWDKVKEGMAAAGIDLDASTNASQTASSGTITTITEETGTKIEGIGQALLNRMASTDDSVMDISKSIVVLSTILTSIATNTQHSADKLDDISTDINYIRKNGISMA